MRRLVAIASRAMVAASFWTDHRNGITAIVTVVVALVLAQLVDRAIAARGSRLADVIPGQLSPTASTRLRLVRRLVYAAIIVIGVALALSQFAAIKRVATGVLASSAVLGLVVGFAARQTLANAVAGVLLAITQPIRIGDLVTFQGETGVVEDVRLTYTYVRTDDGRRVIIPNEQLAQNTVQNHTIVDPRVRVEASVWIPREVDALRALAVLRGESDVDVSIADIEKDAVRLVAGTWARNYSERGPLAAGLRASCLERLRSAGLSSQTAE
jgi:small-conductance mechanosensitive channel